MRSNRPSFIIIAPLWAVSLGDIACSTACISGLVSAAHNIPKQSSTRSSSLPELSNASTVFSNEGSSLLLTMASISALCTDIACVSAGSKCSALMRSKGGTPKRSFHSVSSGFSIVCSVLGVQPCITNIATARARKTMPNRTVRTIGIFSPFRLAAIERPSQRPKNIAARNAAVASNVRIMNFICIKLS